MGGEAAAGPGSRVAASDNRMRLELPARASNLALARAAVAAFAAHLPFSVEDIDDLKVAVSEAVSNVILHAYPEDQPGGVVVWATIDGDLLEVGVEDAGRGIADVDRARAAAFTTSPDRMGLGFVLMDSFMDEVAVSSAVDQGTKVVMQKRARRRTQGGTAVADEPNPTQSTL